MSEETGVRQRLLIVDDSKVIRVTARKILRDHFETVEAVDGENAWETINNEAPFSLIVSDLTMPNLDGFGLLERIRSSRNPEIRDIPVIIITGANDSEKTKLRASQAGATDFIGKPFDSVHLLARTQAHANARSVALALRQEAFTLEDQATTDALTGLLNEVALMERGYQQLSYAIRHKMTLSVALIEIDNYLELGRQHGKSAAEAMIKSVASTLNAEVRQEDIVARTGTARFCLLLPGMNMSGIHNLAERISVRVRTSPVKEGEKRINVTISIGVATPEIRRDTRLEDLLSEAASHLSRASSGGGNQAVIDDSRHDHTGSYTFEPAGKAAMPVEAIIDILHGADTTEIEIGIPQGFEPGENPQTEELTLECRETADPASLPATFAGPVSETPQVARDGFPAENGPDSTTAFGGLSILDPEAPQGKAVFAIEDDESGPDETIIITAPFDVHSTSEAENTRETLRMSQSVSTPSAKTQVTPSAPPEQNSDVIPETEVKGQEDIEEIPVRPGFMRRILRAIFSPFGRRKPD